MILRTRIIRVTIAAYCVLTLPMVFVFLKSEYVRYVAIQTATNLKGKLTSVPSAYVGDSITAGGRNWGAPLGAINLAGDGYTVWQIEDQLAKAEKYSPKRLFILAGTNDILGRRPFSHKEFEKDYARLLDRALKTKAEVFVTLIPLTSRAEVNQAIPSANHIIQALADSRGIATIDLNPTIAPNGTLLPTYTVDGVHFTPKAYTLWRTKLHDVIEETEAEQGAAANADKPRG
jgi:hypothetical protein